MEQIECGNEELIHVGNSLQNDILGSNLSGIKSIWINRDQKKSVEGIKSDFVCTTLTKILEIL